MEREAAIELIQDACKTMSLQLMRLTPAARKIGDEATQADILKSSYAITIEVEVIKKKLLQLLKDDDSTDL
jgi:hypothetical protein